jgi:multiple sugar transport system substrate-binding protein
VRELSGYMSGSKDAKAALDAAAVEISNLLGSCAPLKYPVQ